ncbi:hypothetical protein N7501_002914 [Penicillium viridicatum]|nr:hypothetical protein N7501_002914 [Penicillium viridicatum]
MCYHYKQYSRTRSDKFITYTGIYKTNGRKKYTAISVGTRHRAISDKPIREVLRKEFEMLLYGITKLLLLEYNITAFRGGRRKRSTLSNNNNIDPSLLARKIKTDTLLTSL